MCKIRKKHDKYNGLMMISFVPSNLDQLFRYPSFQVELVVTWLESQRVLLSALSIISRGNAYLARPLPGTGRLTIARAIN